MGTRGLFLPGRPRRRNSPGEGVPSRTLGTTASVRVSSADMPAVCPRHPEQEAALVCSRCGDFLCSACVRGDAGLCVECFEREPKKVDDLAPWSVVQRSAPVFLRLFVVRTLLHIIPASLVLV